MLRSKKVVPIKEIDISTIIEFIIVLESVGYDLQITYIDMLKDLGYEIEEQMCENKTIRAYQGIEVNIEKKTAIVFDKTSNLYFPEVGKIYMDGQSYVDKILEILN